jgi:drug/metabolite transporter (DMT)-like permease
MSVRSAVVAILVAIVWGLCFVLIKASLPNPAPLLLAGLRAVIGSAVLGGWLVLRTRRRAGEGKSGRTGTTRRTVGDILLRPQILGALLDV